MALQRISAASPLEKILATLDGDGGLIVEGLFEAAVIEQMREDILEAAADFQPVRPPRI